MKYLLLIHNDPGAWNALAAGDVEEVMRAHTALQRELRESGEFVEAHELAEQAMIVRTDAAGKTATDGPFMETKEIVAGYYVVDCVDLERAAEIAGKLGEARLWPVEVRRIDP
ncbi:MAG: YciI family protein [Actinomycetales bacterium]